MKEQGKSVQRSSSVSRMYEGSLVRNVLYEDNEAEMSTFHNDINAEFEADERNSQDMTSMDNLHNGTHAAGEAGNRYHIIPHMWNYARLLFCIAGVVPIYRPPSYWRTVPRVVVTWGYSFIVSVLLLLRVYRTCACLFVGRFKGEEISFLLLLCAFFYVLSTLFISINKKGVLHQISSIYDEVGLILHPHSRQEVSQYRSNHRKYAQGVARTNSIVLLVIVVATLLFANLKKLSHLSPNSEFDSDLFPVCDDELMYNFSRVAFVLFLLITDAIYFSGLGAAVVLINTSLHITRRHLRDVNRVLEDDKHPVHDVIEMRFQAHVNTDSKERERAVSLAIPNRRVSNKQGKNDSSWPDSPPSTIEEEDEVNETPGAASSNMEVDEGVDGSLSLTANLSSSVPVTQIDSLESILKGSGRGGDGDGTGKHTGKGDRRAQSMIVGSFDKKEREKLSSRHSSDFDSMDPTLKRLNASRVGSTAGSVAASTAASARSSFSGPATTQISLYLRSLNNMLNQVQIVNTTFFYALFLFAMFTIGWTIAIAVSWLLDEPADRLSVYSFTLYMIPPFVVANIILLLHAHHMKLLRQKKRLFEVVNGSSYVTSIQTRPHALSARSVTIELLRETGKPREGL